MKLNEINNTVFKGMKNGRLDGMDVNGIKFVYVTGYPGRYAFTYKGDVANGRMSFNHHYNSWEASNVWIRIGDEGSLHGIMPKLDMPYYADENMNLIDNLKSYTAILVKKIEYHRKRELQ